MSCREAALPSRAPVSSPAALRTEARFVAVLAELRPESPASLAHVRRALHDFVDRARASGWSAEAVIIGVKRAAVSAKMLPGRVLVVYQRPSTVWDTALSQLITWSIERYYARSPRRLKDGKRGAIQPLQLEV
ncbi:MAG: hypothetical protein NVS4B3_00440 [Gemmatimonadaceae bacterium]